MFVNRFSDFKIRKHIFEHDFRILKSENTCASMIFAPHQPIIQQYNITLKLRLFEGEFPETSYSMYVSTYWNMLLNRFRLSKQFLFVVRPRILNYSLRKQFPQLA
jgi:hypothetical protein